jgi:ribonucleoside-diphosphate reductase alpha chain
VHTASPAGAGPLQEWRLSTQALSLRWHQEKYAQAGEITPEDSRRRVAHALAQVEPWRNRAAWAQRFERAMNQGLLPAGRIMAGAGTVDGAAAKRSLMNCFVLPTQPLHQLPHRLMRTLQAGGGVGMDFSSLPFGVMEQLDRCEQWAQSMEQPPGGAPRRAAQMAVLSARHAAFPAFIAADPSAHPHVARAVALDDDFMRSAQSEVSTESQALRAMAEAVWTSGEPSVLFVTRIQADDNLADHETLLATNPCGEQPLPAFGACALASLDLTRVIQRPFASEAHVAWGLLAALVHVGVRLLDDALEWSPWPLPEQASEMRRHRRIGLGITGLGDALAMLNLHYASPAACDQARLLMRFIAHSAYRASVRLSRERGPYPAFCASGVLRSPRFASRLPADLRHDIRRYGLRHSHLLAIAPAASISVAYADGVSTGVEPMTAAQWRRTWQDPQGRRCSAWVHAHAWRLWQMLKGEQQQPTQGWAWLDRISPDAQLHMVAALAPHVDGGISKTVSMPPSTTAQEIERLIRLAWRLQLKGLALFRRGSRTGVITTGNDPAADASCGPCP